MILKLIRYLQGYVKIRITGYSPERFLNLCSRHHIFIWGLSPSGDSYEMFLMVKGFRKLKPIIRKTHTKVTVLQRYGLPFFLHKYRKRYLFFAGAAICTLLIYLLSLHIWNIHIEGNYSRTDSTILSFLETKNIRHGMWKRQVDCSRIVKDLRAEYDDVIWASASLKGTRLIIQIKENMDTMPEDMEEMTSNEEQGPTDLVAEEAGVITSIITRKGVPQVEPGTEVAPGDLLVSGQVPVVNDSQEIVSYQQHAADADILIRTQIPYEASIPLMYQAKIYQKETRHFPWIQVGNLYLKAGTLLGLKKEAETEGVSEGYTVKLGENLYLPVSYGLETVKTYVFQEKKHTDQEIREMLSEDFARFCLELEKKGVQILENNVKIYKENTTAVSRGNLTVIKPAGRAVPAEPLVAGTNEGTEGEE